MDYEKKVEKKLPSSTEVLPLKDFRICFNEHDIKIKKGEKIRVPNMFLENLVTEKVIKKG